MGKRLRSGVIPILLILLMTAGAWAQVTVTKLEIDSILYIRPNPPEYAVFNTDFDLFVGEEPMQIESNKGAIRYKGTIQIPAGASAGSEENPTILVSRPLIGIKYAVPKGRTIPYGGIQIWINGSLMEYFDELSNRKEDGVMFQLSEPFIEGINTVEVIITDNTDDEDIKSWQLLVQPRIEAATSARLLQLTRSVAPEQSSNPVFSPDGKLIAYQSQIREQANVMIMNTDGSDPRLITETSAPTADEFELAISDEEEYAFGLAWLSDSRHMVFTTSRTGNYELFIADVTVTPPAITQLTYSDAFDGAPDLDPEGKKLAFVSNRDGNAEIFVFEISDAKNTLQQVTTTEGVNLSPRWSPDGKQIAYSYREDERDQYGIYLISPGDPAPVEITKELEGECRFPSWSPDGSKIAFYWNQRIAIYSKITNKVYDDVVQQDVLPPQNQRGPIWSPDGTTIVFSSNKQHNPVYAINLNEQNDGSLEPNEYVIIEPELSKRNMEMDWSPTYEMIVFRSLKSKAWDLWGLQLDIKPKNARIRVNAPFNSYLTLGLRPVGFVSKTVPNLSYFGTDSHPVGVAEYTLNPPGSRRYQGTLLLRPAVDNRIEFIGRYSSWLDWRAGLRSAIVPGWGQLHRGHFSSAAFFSVSAFSFWGFGIYSDMQAEDYYNDYLNETSKATAMAQIRQDWKDSEAKRNALITTGSALWAWNTLDALFPVKRSHYLTRANKKKLDKLPWGKIINSPYGTDRTLGAIGVVAYHPDSEVWLKPFLEDEFIYYGSAFNSFEEEVTFTIPLEPGQYEIRVVKRNRKEFSNSLVTVQAMIKSTIFVGKRELHNTLPMRLALGIVPGLQQAVGQRDFRKAGKIWLLTGASLTGIFLSNAAYQDACDAYEAAPQASVIDERERRNYTDAYRQAFLGVSIGVFLHNYWDAVIGGD